MQHYPDLEVQGLIQKAEVEGSPVPGWSMIDNKTLFQNQTKQNRTIMITNSAMKVPFHIIIQIKY